VGYALVRLWIAKFIGEGKKGCQRKVRGNGNKISTNTHISCKPLWVKTNGVGVPKWKLQGFNNGRGTRGDYKLSAIEFQIKFKNISDKFSRNTLRHGLEEVGWVLVRL